MRYTKEEFAIVEPKFLEMGYRKFSGNGLKHEDYGFWKSFDVTKDADGEKVIGYQVAFLIYDFSKYDNFREKESIGIQFEFNTQNESIATSGFQASISDDKMSFEEFEKFCANLYAFLKEGTQKNC